MNLYEEIWLAIIAGGGAMGLFIIDLLCVLAWEKFWELYDARMGRRTRARNNEIDREQQQRLDELARKQRRAHVVRMPGVRVNPISGRSYKVGSDCK